MEHKPINVVALLGKVDFAPETIVETAAHQSVLFVEAIQYRLSQLELKSSAKMDWERERAECELRIRQQAKVNDEKITEGHIAAKLLLDKAVSDKAAKLARAEILDAYSKLVVEAFEMRRDCLQIIKGLVKDEYSMQAAMESGAEKMRETRKKLRDRFPAGQ